MIDDFLCLKCKFKKCDDVSPKCLYRIEGRTPPDELERNWKFTAAIKQARALVTRLGRLRGKQDRSEYFRLRYLADPQTKINAVMDRYHARRNQSLTGDTAGTTEL